MAGAGIYFLFNLVRFHLASVRCINQDTQLELKILCLCPFSDVGSVEGLAYHRAWDTLYWTSSTTSTISRQTLDQNRVGAFTRQAVVTLSEEDHPHVLALDECQKSVPLLKVTFLLDCSHFNPESSLIRVVNLQETVFSNQS